MPLVDSARHLSSITEALSTKLENFGTSVPPPQPPTLVNGAGDVNGSAAREWEFGRSAYLKWATNKGQPGDSSSGRVVQGMSAEPALESYKQAVDNNVGAGQADDLARFADTFSSSRS